MVARYVHDIAAWMDGTESLTDGQYRAYHVVCELIYLNDGPILPHESGIAGRCHQHVLAFRRNLAALVEMGKLALVDGKLANRRASAELDRIPNLRRRPNPPAIPGAPPAHPRRTTARPPGGSAAKSLRTNGAAPDERERGLSIPSYLPLETPNLDVDSAERSSRVWDFDAFWRHYPHRVGKGAARKAFDAASKKSGVMFPDLMAGLARYAAKTDDRPWCNPATWLNQERWLDEPARNNGGQNGNNKSVADAWDRLRGRLEGDARRDEGQGDQLGLPAQQLRGP